jgi:hypothetical protein
LLLCSSYLPLGVPNWVVICPHHPTCTPHHFFALPRRGADPHAAPLAQSGHATLPHGCNADVDTSQCRQSTSVYYSSYWSQRRRLQCHRSQVAAPPITTNLAPPFAKLALTTHLPPLFVGPQVIIPVRPSPSPRRQLLQLLGPSFGIWSSSSTPTA